MGGCILVYCLEGTSTEQCCPDPTARQGYAESAFVQFVCNLNLECHALERTVPEEGIPTHPSSESPTAGQSARSEQKGSLPADQSRGPDPHAAKGAVHARRFNVTSANAGVKAGGLAPLMSANGLLPVPCLRRDTELDQRRDG